MYPSTVPSVVKCWLKELPEPLLTYRLYDSFINAATSILDSQQVRRDKIVECVECLPDPNYVTLKYFMTHLYKVLGHVDSNYMTVSKLSFVFGPILLRPPTKQHSKNVIERQRETVRLIFMYFIDELEKEIEEENERKRWEERQRLEQKRGHKRALEGKRDRALANVYTGKHESRRDGKKHGNANVNKKRAR